MSLSREGRVLGIKEQPGLPFCKRVKILWQIRGRQHSDQENTTTENQEITVLTLRIHALSELTAAMRFALAWRCRVVVRVGCGARRPIPSQAFRANQWESEVLRTVYAISGSERRGLQVSDTSMAPVRIMRWKVADKGNRELWPE